MLNNAQPLGLTIDPNSKTMLSGFGLEQFAYDQHTIPDLNETQGFPLNMNPANNILPQLETGDDTVPDAASKPAYQNELVFQDSPMPVASSSNMDSNPNGPDLFFSEPLLATSPKTPEEPMRKHLMSIPEFPKLPEEQKQQDEDKESKSEPRNILACSPPLPLISDGEDVVMSDTIKPESEPPQIQIPDIIKLPVEELDPTVRAMPVQITPISPELDKKKPKKKLPKKSKLSKEKKYDKPAVPKKKNSGKGKIKKMDASPPGPAIDYTPSRKRKASEANLSMSGIMQKKAHMTRNSRTQQMSWQVKFGEALTQFRKKSAKQKIQIHFFWEPVDEIRHTAPNYNKVIRFPMDFGTIKNKLDAQAYATIGECIRDCELVFFNARLYNKDGHYVYAESQKAQKFFMNEKNGFHSIVFEHGNENDQKAWRTQHGLGQYGPFCYDPEFDKDKRLFPS